MDVTSPAARPPRRVVALVALVVAGAFVASACGAIAKVRNAVNHAEANLHTVDAFAAHLQQSPTGAFAVTYTTTGSAPAGIVYASNPAANELTFQQSQSGAGATNTRFVSNASGDYLCTQAGAGAAWSCDKLSSSDAASHQQAFAAYTPAHWVDFLKGLSVAAGLEGGTVTTSAMVVNGFDLECLNLTLKNVSGTTTVCTTPQGLLGYVKAPQDSTSFEITNYTTAPSPSLFQLPPGATVTTGTSP